MLSARGRHDRAIELAREAVALISDAESPTLRADVLMALAKVLRAADEPAHALTAAAEAVELFERKGSEPGAAHARAFVAGIAS
jgi:hypothetical protein